MKRLCIVWLLLISILFIKSSPAIARDSVGEIGEVFGPATVIGINGKETSATPGLSLFPGDVLKTGKGGRISFSLNLPGLFRISEESEISIDELSDWDSDKKQTTLRLIVGYLWSEIKKVANGDDRELIHTPTAVIGVRGTEFDTVVALDATTAVAVDDGVVAVSSDGKEKSLEKGMMIQLNMDEDRFTLEKAQPKENRNWGSWRNKRRARFLGKFDKIGDGFQGRFKRMMDRHGIWSRKIDKATGVIKKEMETARRARRQGKKRALGKSLRRLRRKAVTYKKKARGYQRVMNRIMVAGKTAQRMERAILANMEIIEKKAGKEKAKKVLAQLKDIQEKKEALGRLSRETVLKIRETFKELQEFKNELARN